MADIVYTKEQEAEALMWVEKLSFCRLDLDVVLAMAKRTAEAEHLRDELRSVRKLYVEQRDTLCSERDALKARVAELESAMMGLMGSTGYCDLQQSDRDRARVVMGGSPCLEVPPSPPVAPTREEVERLADKVAHAEASLKTEREWHIEARAEVERLRAKLETVTRERDSWRAQRDEVHAEMERQTQLKREERQAKLDAQRERDEARADAARLREALTQVRDAMRATGQEPDGNDDPRRPVASAVWHALASLPSAEPTPVK